MASYPKQKLMSFKSTFGFCLNEKASISLTKNKSRGGGGMSEEVERMRWEKKVMISDVNQFQKFRILMLLCSTLQVLFLSFYFIAFFPQRYLTFNLGCKLLKFCNLFISLKIFKSIFGNMFTDLSQNIEICHKILKLIWKLHMLSHLNKSNFSNLM